ncbi:Allene oxide synthase-lipoxygenase protein [Acropora cervicornis]|uniref:Allene oxide synthase-lipoxygenase protein n=1 Tax=Acropora cervicornis TaxID=6130 RepID=A0AAD9Q4H0_ACRCE|nr:Allene oxide synthase-lipoxygenase protein [Acropora cervicornis]
MGIVTSKRRNTAVTQSGSKTTDIIYKEQSNEKNWMNEGFAIYKELQGDELFSKKMKEADEPPSDAGALRESQIAFYVKKYQVASTLKSLATQQRGGHRSVGATGAATVLNNPLLPEHEYFTAGRVFPIRVRHSNFHSKDDAGSDVRMLSIKFADSEYESPFDLLMYTGEKAAFWNIYSFDKMLTALKEGREAFQAYCLANPHHFHLVIAAFRRAPDSFTDQRYYTWLAFEYKAKDGVQHYAKFRIAFRVFVGDVPPAADHWRDDSFYGAHYLNGCNPDTIKRCTEIPSKFPVTQELVANLLDEGDTLQVAIEHGRVYMTDFKILEDILHYGEKDEMLERRYACPAMGLFYVKGTGEIVPVAIQFFQEPSETNPIWTPNDSEMDWIFAKMWLRNADTQWHQMITHLLRCHLCMEPFAVASWRQLPSLHPVWKLLKPHIKGVMAINTVGRERLIPAGGHIELMKKYFRTLNLSSYDLPQVLKDRGVVDPEKLPHFYYRDDALKLWDAIKDFVSKMLSIYYQSDEDIHKDSELQAWILDLHDNGYPIREGESDHGIPSSIKTAAQLTHLLTIIIFSCSCQYAAVNFSQMDTFGFLPNSPAIMRQPPPTQKGNVTEKDIMKCLANKHQAAVTIATVFDLTRIFPDEEMAAREAILRFQGKLHRISRSIKKRNETLKFPYTYLLPEKVLNSIAI